MKRIHSGWLADRVVKGNALSGRTRSVFMDRTAGWVAIVQLICGVPQAGAGFSFQIGGPPPPTVSFSDVSVVKTNMTASPVLYIEALNTASNQFVRVYPKLIGQPVNATVGTAPLSNGVYTLSFYFRFIDLIPDEFYVSWSGQASSTVRLTGTNVPGGVPTIYPDVWYRGSVAVAVSNGPDTGRFMFQMMRNGAGFFPDHAVQFRDISLLDGTGQERMQSSIDYANTGIDQEPMNVRRGGTAQIRRFRVMNNLEHQAIPAWFDTQRVHLHSQLRVNAPASRTNDIFQTAETHLGDRGYGGTLTRWVKRPLNNAAFGPSFDGPYWPTLVPDSSPPSGETWFNPLIVWGGVTNSVPAMNAARAHANGLHSIGYYLMMAEDNIATNHPEWICRDAGGEMVPLLTGGTYVGEWLCQNTEYREIVTARLKEMISQGLDGAYFDYIHQPVVCWCPRCDQSFRNRFGTPPSEEDPPNLTFKNPQVIRTYYLRGQILRNAFSDYQTAMQGIHPDECSPASVSQFRFWDYSGYPSSFIEILRSSKWEFDTQFGRRAYLYNVWFPGGTIYPQEDQLPVDSWGLMGFTFLRDAANGRPPHIWVEPHAGLTNSQTKASATMRKASTAFLLTAGCVANLHISDWSDATNESAWAESFGPAVEMGKKVSPLLAGAKPYKWAGIHFNEYASSQIYLGGGNSTKQDAYTRVMAPALFAYDALAKQSPQVPVTFLTDQQLARGELDGYQSLFLPSDNMTPPMMESLSGFTGTVIRQSENTDWIWHVASGRPTNEFRAAVFPNGSVTNAPIRVTQNSANKFTTGFYTKVENGTTNYLVTICNDIEWLFSEALSDEEKAAHAPSNLTAVNVYFTVPVKTAAGWIKDTSGSTNLTAVAGTVTGNTVRFNVGTVSHMAVLKVEAQ